MYCNRWLRKREWEFVGILLCEVSMIVGNGVVEEVDSFKYFGVNVIIDGGSMVDIKVMFNDWYIF